MARPGSPRLNYQTRFPDSGRRDRSNVPCRHHVFRRPAENSCPRPPVFAANHGQSARACIGNRGQSSCGNRLSGSSAMQASVFAAPNAFRALLSGGIEQCQRLLCARGGPSHGVKNDPSVVDTSSISVLLGPFFIVLCCVHFLHVGFAADYSAVGPKANTAI